MTTVVARALKTPRCSRIPDEYRGSAPTPPMVSLSRPQSGDPCRHAVGGTPPQDGTRTASIPIACASGTQAGCRVIPRPAVGGVLGTPWCRSRLRRNRLPPPSSTGSFQTGSFQQQIIRPSGPSPPRRASHATGRQASRPQRDSANRRPEAAAASSHARNHYQRYFSKHRSFVCPILGRAFGNSNSEADPRRKRPLNRHESTAKAESGTTSTTVS